MSTSRHSATSLGHPRFSEDMFKYSQREPQFSGSLASRRTATPVDAFRKFMFTFPNMWGIPEDKVVNGFHMGDPKLHEHPYLHDAVFRPYKVPNTGYPLVALRGNKVLKPAVENDVIRLPLNISFEDMADILSHYFPMVHNWVLLDGRKIPYRWDAGRVAHNVPVIANGEQLETYVTELQGATGEDHGFKWVVYEDGHKPTYATPGEKEGHRRLAPLGRDLSRLIMDYVRQRPSKRRVAPATAHVPGAGGPDPHDPDDDMEELLGGVRRPKKSTRRRHSKSRPKQKRSRSRRSRSSRRSSSRRR